MTARAGCPTATSTRRPTASVRTGHGGAGCPGRPSRNFDLLTEDIMGPLLRLPKHPLALARFGAPTVLPASVTARFFRTEQARALCA
ncbi:MAG TPA: hypothetical protein VML93_22745, partial [Mycobacterium sp.]|nr:hypothetical protein [Mycobacterium sp.]